MRSRHLLRRLIRIPLWKLRLLLEAAFWLLLARIALLVLPFPRIGRHLGALQAPSQEIDCVNDERTVLATRVGQAVNAAADHMPLRLVCLPRALAGWQMLHRRGVQSRLHFGALPKPDAASSGLSTHAWLTSRGVEVTGYPVAHGCVELGYFARDVQPGLGERMQATQ